MTVQDTDLCQLCGHELTQQPGYQYCPYCGGALHFTTLNGPEELTGDELIMAEVLSDYLLNTKMLPAYRAVMVLQKVTDTIEQEGEE